MADTENPHTHMASLRAQLDLFISLLQECATSATVYKIPRYDGVTGVPPDPDSQRVVPTRIVPECINGDAAVLEAVTAFRGLSRPKDQLPGTVQRSAGVVFADKDLSGVVDSINNVKLQLKKSIFDKYPNSRSRNQFVRTEFPGRVMLQVYRKINFNNDPIDTIRLAWNPFTESNKYLTQTQVLEMLNKRNQSGIDHTDAQRHKALTMAMESVSSNKSTTKYAIRKRRAPYPTATVYRSGEKPKTVPMSVPLILGPASDARTIEIGALPVYDEKDRRSPRSDKLKMELLFKPLYLYVRQS